MKDDRGNWLRGKRGEALSDALRASKATGPSEAQRKRLEAALGIGAGGGAPPSTLPKPHFPGYWLAIPALIGAGAVAAWKLGAGHSEPPPRIAEPTPIVSATAPEVPSVPASIAPPVSAPTATATLAPPPASAKKTVSAAAADPDAELAIVKLAEDLLERDPSAALAKANERERRFPNGLFGEEGEVVAIDALARLGRAPEARTRADAFLAAHPSSAYRTRIVRALARLGTHDE